MSSVKKIQREWKKPNDGGGLVVYNDLKRKWAQTVLKL